MDGTAGRANPSGGRHVRLKEMGRLVITAAALAPFAWCALAAQEGSKAKANEVWYVLRKKLSAASSAAGAFEVRAFGETEAFAFSFLRPNYGRFSSKNLLIVQDGKSHYLCDIPAKRYSVLPAPGKGMLAGTALNLGGLSGLEALALPHEPELTPVSVASQTFAGRACDALTLVSEEMKGLRITLFVDRQTGLPAGWKYAAGDFRSEGVFKRLRLDSQLAKTDFVWKPPAGAKPFKTGGGALSSHGDEAIAQSVARKNAPKDQQDGFQPLDSTLDMTDSDPSCRISGRIMPTRLMSISKVRHAGPSGRRPAPNMV
jgi:outer membrane lipoprotein-sorting protein